MKDAEIKNALEKAINEYAAEDVGSPKYFKLIIAILDLFNRQQAGKEALIAGQETLQKALAEKIAEIERLKNECFCIANERDAIKDCLDTAVEEAIEEFAERLKEHAYRLPTSFFEIKAVNESWIDAILKEMVGDAE